MCPDSKGRECLPGRNAFFLEAALMVQLLKGHKMTIVLKATGWLFVLLLLSPYSHSAPYLVLP